MLPIALVMSGLLACGPGSSEVQECAAKSAAMRALFAQAGDATPTINLQPGMRIPESSHGTAPTEGIALFILADGRFVFEDQPATLEVVQEPLTEAFRMAIQLGENIGQPWKGRVLILADMRAPAAALASFAATLPPDVALSLIVNLAGDIVPLAPPLPPAVEAAIRVPAKERSPRLAQVITAAIGDCEPLRAVFDAVATTTADRRNEVLLAGLPDAVDKCACAGVDVEVLVSAVWNMSGKDAPTMRQLDLPLSRDPTVEALELPPSATIQAFLTLVEARGARPFRLAPTP